MRNIYVIVRRELTAYFTRPIGYIYLFTFILFTNMLGLFFLKPGFFEYPIADMRRYFHVFAGVSSFLVAAITMRLWAEDREGNTYEMLLTFPMRATELVLGKFLASLVFFGAGLLCTLTVPLMMAYLSQSGADDLSKTGICGLLDFWPMVSGYCGALLLGAVFISFGLFVSGLCRDQIVAFVMTAPALFLAYILGVDFIKASLNSALSFFGKDVGATIGDFTGIFMHYDNLARGLVQGSDIVFFLIWIVVFLILNGLAIERRCRPHNLKMYLAAVVILIAIGFVGNLITSRISLGRYDLTEEKIFTVDPVSVKVLRRLKDPVSIRYVVSPRDKLPSQLQNLERDVRDKLDALKMKSNGMLRYKIIVQEPLQGLKKDDTEEEEGSVEKRILKKIKPFSVEVPGRDRVTAQIIYSGLEISYMDKESEVISPLSPRELPQLEYSLIKYIDKMTREKAPVVALVAPKNEIPPQMAMFYRQMGRPVPPPNDPFEYLQGFLQRENYEVRRVKITRDSPLPDDYDVLAIVEPKELTARQKWEINRALVNGKLVFLAVQNAVFDYKAVRGGLEVKRKSLNPGINEVLLPNGVSVDSAFLMDPSASTIQVPVQTILGTMMQTFPPLPMHSSVKPDNMNRKHPAMQGVNEFRYYWGTPLQLDQKLLKKNDIKVTRLMQSSAGCWKRTLAGDALTNADIKPPATRSKPMLLAALFEGQFQDVYAGQEPPEWSQPQQPPMPGRRPPPPSEPGPINPKPGKLILVGNAEVFSKSFISWGQMNFFLNSIGFLGLDETGRDIRALRDKTFRLRNIGAFADDAPFFKSADFWRFLQTLGHGFVLTGIGVAIFLYRRRRRESYTVGSL